MLNGNVNASATPGASVSSLLPSAEPCICHSYTLSVSLNIIGMCVAHLDKNKPPSKNFKGKEGEILKTIDRM